MKKLLGLGILLLSSASIVFGSVGWPSLVNPLVLVDCSSISRMKTF